MPEPEPTLDDMDMGDPGSPPLFEPILWRIRRAFLPPVPPIDTPEDVASRMKCVEMLAKQGRQAEGWLKTELMVILEELKAEGEVRDWCPEAAYDRTENGGRQKCDFVLKLPAEGNPLIGVEVKTALVGDQRGHFLENGDIVETEAQAWSLKQYTSGLVADALRLAESALFQERVCLLFAYGHRDDLRQQDIDQLEGRVAGGVRMALPAFAVTVPRNLALGCSIGDELALWIVGFVVTSAVG